MSKQIHSKSTLMGWSKEDLVAHCMALEHNNQVLNENFDRQYDNCMKMVRGMEIINDTYKKRNEQQPPADPSPDLMAEFNPIYDTVKAKAMNKASSRLGRALTSDEEAAIYHGIMTTILEIKRRQRGGSK